MKEEFNDKNLGLVCIKRNARALNIIARKKIGFIELTAPLNISITQIRLAFEQMKPRLGELKEKTHYILDPNSVLQTLSFSLKIENKQVRNFHANLQDTTLHIICPNIENFEDSVIQNMLKSVIEQAMRKEAKRIYPAKLEYLANLYGFKYKSLSVNKSKTRWGSCSSKKSINMSYFSLFLPEYLIDFVMLHELCHTVEMNHGDKFWKLLDNVTDNKAKALTLELKNASIPW